MAKLGNKKDRERTESAVDFGGGNILKLEDGHNFFVLLSEDYGEGHVHWIKAAKQTFRRVCLGGIDGKGWDPENCSLCALAKELYDMRKEAKSEGDATLAKEYLERGNQVKSNYSATFSAVRFQTVNERVGTRKPKKRGSKGRPIFKAVPNFDQFETGKLSLSYAQMKKLFEIIDAEDEEGNKKYDFVEDGSDLIGRVLDLHKYKVGEKDTYTRVGEIIPLEEEIDLEELELKEDEIPDVFEDYNEDDDLESIVELYKSELDGTEEEYTEEDLEKKKKKTKSNISKASSKKKTTAKKKKTEPEEVEEEVDEEGYEDDEYEDDEYEDEDF